MTTQSCPRRMQEWGPWERQEELDQWVTNRWLTDPEQVKRQQEEADARLSPGTTVHRSEHADLWLWHWGPPRTCNFCGSIHPEDAFRLLEEGWEQEFAKSYKAYLNPPGSSVRLKATLASLRDPTREPFQGVPSIWSPVPPVKLYIQHCTSEEISRLNALLRGETQAGE